MTLAALCGPFGWPGSGLAAPKPVPLPSFDGPAPDPNALPGGSRPAPPGPRQPYEYENPAEWLRNRPQPQRHEVAAAMLSPKAKVPGTWEHCLKRWQDYQLKKAAELSKHHRNPGSKRPSRVLPWDKWLRQYIPNQGNDNQGKAFVKHLVERLKLGANHGWQTELHVPEANRYYDLANVELGLLYEVKSGRGIDAGELARDKALLEIERGKPNPRQLVYLFPDQPSKKAKKLLKEAGISYAVLPAQKRLINPGGTDPGGTAPGGADPGGADPGGADPDDSGPNGGGTPKGGPQGGGPRGGASADDTLRAPDQYQAPAPAPAEIADSGDTPEEAAELRQVNQQLAADSGHPDLAQDLGGVDFSTLELRYVSDTYHNGSGVQYAFKADALPADEQSFGGRRAAQLASDSFFVWLELPPSAFTVNLNPDEPNRIIDEKFGQTDAGRVLLEADLAMKKSVAKFIHPDTPGGKKYWDSLWGETKCVSMRQWIVPDTATVRDNGNELYILDAPLLVKMESEVIETPGVGGDTGCGQQDEASTQHNESVYRTTILPQIQKAVNHAPEYADLRRVYASRVAAEWFRKRSAGKHTAYSDLIGKGDISRWASREKWTPREVFDRYVQSYKNGEFKVKHTTTEGNVVYTRTYVYGGVDFSQIDQNRLSATKFAKDHPALTATARNALHEPSGEGRDVWLGGQTTAVPLAEAFAGPDPATSKPLFYVLGAVPLTAWLVTGGMLLWRRRANSPARAGR
ncbi:hypothetical protein [Streptomyces xantholiticus]|uniref:hypothetical protein n=1 Tax=Streptomyces xantholiticus TaxID=68285 RepID=UPI00167756A1|nr:hypothetical protein [Streptomyces xantholiticus]GGW39561.1 hypothetical protein GCM10010381_25340 [Streptomyces xantholiticus]